MTITAALAWVAATQHPPGQCGWGAPDDRGPRLRPLPVRHRPRHRGAAAGADPHRNGGDHRSSTPPPTSRALIAGRRSVPSPLRAATYQTLIGLLAATGLRIGEAIKLDRADVDWDEGVLLIRESKFGKSRLVPLHASTHRRAARLRRPPG